MTANVGTRDVNIWFETGQILLDFLQMLDASGGGNDKVYAQGDSIPRHVTGVSFRDDHLLLSSSNSSRCLTVRELAGTLAKEKETGVRVIVKSQEREFSLITVSESGLGWILW